MLTCTVPGAPSRYEFNVAETMPNCVIWLTLTQSQPPMFKGSSGCQAVNMGQKLQTLFDFSFHFIALGPVGPNPVQALIRK